MATPNSASGAERRAGPKLAEVGKAAAQIKALAEAGAAEARRAADEGAAQVRRLTDQGATRFRTYSEEGAAGAQKLMESTMEQATKATETMMKAAEEAAEFGRGNVEAFTRAAQVYAAGVQDLGRQTFAMVQGLADHAMEGAKALAAVKSLHEAAQIQATYARGAVEKALADGGKIGEGALKLAEQAFAPISARVSLAAERAGRAVPLAA